MTAGEFIQIAVGVATIASVIGGIAFLHGKMSEWQRGADMRFSRIETALDRDGDSALVRQGQLDVLKLQADKEHAELWQTLDKHDGRISTVERAVLGGGR